jgi:hypothetical protein
LTVKCVSEMFRRLRGGRRCYIGIGEYVPALGAVSHGITAAGVKGTRSVIIMPPYDWVTYKPPEERHPPNFESVQLIDCQRRFRTGK